MLRCLNLSHGAKVLLYITWYWQEFGKSKIYLPLQEDVEVLNKEVYRVIMEHYSLHPRVSASSFVELRLLTGSGH